LWSTLSLVLQLTLCIITWNRGDGSDKRNVIGHLAIIGAGILHVWLTLIVVESDTLEECSDRNRQVSFLFGMNLMAMPMAMSYRAFLGVIMNDQMGSRVGPCSYMLKKDITELKKITIFWWSATTLVAAGMQYDGMWGSCTTIGSSGNMIFPVLLFPELIHAYKPCRYICWYFFMVLNLKAFFVNVRPDSAAFMWTAWICSGPVAVYFYGNEWAGAWFPLNFIVAFGYIIAPLKLEKKYNLSIPGNVEPAYLLQEQRLAEEQERYKAEAAIKKQQEPPQVDPKDAVISMQPGH